MPGLHPSQSSPRDPVGGPHHQASHHHRHHPSSLLATCVRDAWMVDGVWQDRVLSSLTSLLVSVVDSSSGMTVVIFSSLVFHECQSTVKKIIEQGLVSHRDFTWAEAQKGMVAVPQD